MKLDTEYLRQHYDSLSDEALLAIDRTDLVEVAQAIFDDEVGRRGLAPPRDALRTHARPIVPRQPEPPDEEAEDDDAEDEIDHDAPGTGEKPDWLEEGAEVYSAYVMPESAVQADPTIARDALETAGIPCYLDVCEAPRETRTHPEPTHLWRLMVPSRLNLQARGIIEREMGNQEMEAYWKAHLDVLSDSELLAMTPEVAFCGLFDRIERVNRVYDEEMARRGLKRR